MDCRLQHKTVIIRNEHLHQWIQWHGRKCQVKRTLPSKLQTTFALCTSQLNDLGFLAVHPRKGKIYCTLLLNAISGGFGNARFLTGSFQGFWNFQYPSPSEFQLQMSINFIHRYTFPNKCHIHLGFAICAVYLFVSSENPFKNFPRTWNWQKNLSGRQPTFNQAVNEPQTTQNTLRLGLVGAVAM